MAKNNFFNGYTLLIIAVCLLIFFSITSAKERKARMIEKLKTGFGKASKRKYTSEELENISHYYEKKIAGDGYIDDVTWNDLDFDEIYKRMNICNSSVGQEYLYKMLRIPDDNIDNLKETDRVSDFWGSKEKDRINIQSVFAKLGFVKGVALSDYIDLVSDLEINRNIFHFCCMLFLAASFIVCFAVNPIVGVFMIIASLTISITTYYKYKAKVAPYFICIKHLIRMAICADEISKINITAIDEYNKKLTNAVSELKKISRNSWLLENGNVSGSFFDIALDYVRMLTHADLIKFNNSIRCIKGKAEIVDSLIDTLGFLEATISVASFRKMVPYWSKPQLVKTKDTFIDIEEVFHPLIEKPVSNSIKSDINVLLTGSNASGKSTFLKTIAINAILSQTIYTSVSKHTYEPIFRVYSSMSLNDDLSSSSSYYMVEIKSLKRIIDASDIKNEAPVLCFVDEVLRGTNTVERIAASSEILKSFTSKNALVFAATHDIELTKMLDGPYVNYHFKEDVEDNGIVFNYKLFKGPATTRNAIKLLTFMGYDKKITDSAEEKASSFLNNGRWIY